jgi:DNA-binding Lrp family transcriptional regulator
MKNLNPHAGKRQITRGYICLPRKFVINLIRNRTLTQSELGSFILLVLSADWDSGSYRNGFIRHSNAELSRIWGISESTFSRNISKFTEKGLIDLSDSATPKINHYQDLFTSKGAQSYAKEKMTNAKLHEMFAKVQESPARMQEQLAEDRRSFNVSSKVESNVYPKRVVVKQEVRSREEYQEIYDQGGYVRLTTDDMKWIDKNVREKKQVNNRLEEKDIIDIFFNGNRALYQENLIYDN